MAFAKEFRIKFWFCFVSCAKRKCPWALPNFSEIRSFRLVLGMATSLPTFAREKTYRKRNEPYRWKWHNSRSKKSIERIHPTPSIVARCAIMPFRACLWVLHTWGSRENVNIRLIFFQVETFVIKELILPLHIGYVWGRVRPTLSATT